MLRARIRLTFGLPHGGEHTETLDVDARMVHSRPCSLISRAAHKAGKRGIKLGCCQRITHRGEEVFSYMSANARL